MGTRSPVAGTGAADHAMSRLRMVLAGVGFPLAAAGVLLDDRRLVWGAIVTLGLALGLRLYAHRSRPQ